VPGRCGLRYLHQHFELVLRLQAAMRRHLFQRARSAFSALSAQGLIFAKALASAGFASSVS
jgi:hypothetical protein